jgi:TonB family protein
LVGPAFVASRSKPDNMQVLDFVPLKTIDALIPPGGGNPHANSPPATFEKPLPAPLAPIVTPPPQPRFEKVREPDPPKDTVKEVSPPKDPDYSLEPSRERKPKKPTIDFTPVTRPARDAKADAKARADAQAREEAREQARQETDRRRRAALAFGNAANSLEEGRSSSTTIEPLKGPGGGGLPYANFLQAVKSIYERTWVVPDGITDDNATTAASVTIARDGTVVDSHITRSSGNPAVDRSVQVTLDRVKLKGAVPLPDDAKENQRTVTINFNVKAKRALG